MSAIARPRRSALFVPGANERALAKAATLPADVLILDLEDAVAPAAKEAARDRVCAMVASSQRDARRGRPEYAIRINPRDTPWHEADLRDAARAGPAAIVAPKVNSAADIRDLDQELDRVAAPAQIRLWAMIETPLAVLRAAEIAAASPRLELLAFGANDLAHALRAEHAPGRLPLLYSLSACLAAARAADKTILDGVFNDVQDVAGFEAECIQGRQLGFDGKTLIHPHQLAPCNRIFAPSEAEVAHAHRIIAAFEIAQASGQGVTAVDGKMIENLHVASARRILNLAAAISEWESA